ncbi:MAG TPA: alpha/beta hydrolase [Vicinamibacteria bacterium]|jgi:pimeloyl-ACP methyl ester carboxylesterase
MTRTTYVLIHGAGDVAWHWHLVSSELRGRGHDVVAVDLPCEDESAGWFRYADTVCEAIGDRSRLVVVAHSLGGFTAPIVCARRRAELLVLVAGMIPVPGESANAYWKNTGYAEARRKVDATDPITVFYHDVPHDLAEQALARGRRQAEAIATEPWPLDAWPQVPVRFLLCRDDRFFPAEWLRQVVRDRLGIVPDEIDGGHCPALARPKELADRLEVFHLGATNAVRPSMDMRSPGRRGAKNVLGPQTVGDEGDRTEGSQ